MKENRESYFARIGRNFVPSDHWRIYGAYQIAKGVHRGQFRKEIDAEGNLIRYFEHLRRASLVIIDEFMLRDADLVIALLFHDGPEDRGMAVAMIETLFGRRPAQTVLCVTHQPDESDEEYAARLLGFASWEDLAAKLADRLDNMRSIGSMPPKKRVAKAKETLELFRPILRDRLQRIAPDSVVSRFQTAWNEIEGICRGILDSQPPPAMPETPPE